jgi:hypothetical protein
MALSGRGGFRGDTRATRLERRGPKPTRKRPPELPPEEQEKLRQEALEERERYRRERVARETGPLTLLPLRLRLARGCDLGSKGVPRVSSCAPCIR